jgi:hypothetical protein
MAVSPPTHARRGAHLVTLDESSGVQVTRAAAYSAALLRISLGLVYLWGFITQAFGVSYTNSTTDPTGCRMMFMIRRSSRPMARKLQLTEHNSRPTSVSQ